MYVLMDLAFLLVLLTDPLTITLAFLAAGLAVLYPFTKRMTHAAPGLAFSMAIDGIQRRDRQRSNRVATLRRQLWTVAYDTEYAMVDDPGT